MHHYADRVPSAHRLAEETSPYLRQHADNPVDWYPWGDEAFAMARARDVPVFLSVGYSACHWCHVMAHESFEDETIAAAVNERFVPVKVDREERPDVDAVYMAAVQAMSGRGGWPMSVFLTPDGRPFFAGTYFPPRAVQGMPGFPDLLDAISEAWTVRRAEVERQADALAAAVADNVGLPDTLVPASGDAPVFASVLGAATAELAARMDPVWGGFGPAPKFPSPTSVDLCLRHWRLTGDDASLAMAARTLDAMAEGGIYDHLGGGFCRYATDATWTVPHFEKMLYDQAGLVRAYLHGWLATGNRAWLQVVEETIGYVLRDLRDPAGGLCSAEDADSEGEEGRFYLWTPADIETVLGPERGRAVMDWYEVSAGPNFEGRSILRRPRGATVLRPADIEDARAELYEARAARVRPGLDDKVLTEWNAMFGAALAEAAAAVGRSDWREAAEALAAFLLGELRRPDGRWLRSWQGGRARHLAYAADYAWTVEFLTRLAELTGRRSYAAEAGVVARELLRLFRQDDGLLATTGHDAEALVVRPVELLDSATPSATSVAAAAFLRLGALLADDEITDAGESLLGALGGLLDKHPTAAGYAALALELAGGGVTEVVVTGDRPDLLRVVRARFEPTAVVAWGEPGDSPLWRDRAPDTAYVCRRWVCRSPATTESELVERLDEEWRAEQVRFAGVGAP